MRADARRNRERIVAAARAVFAERGLDVSLDDIAERAGVGIGTLYRRFPSREELVAAVFEAKLREYAGAAEEALPAAGTWAGFTAFVERICAMQAADRGFTDLVTMSLPGSPEAQRLHRRAQSATVDVIQRAQEAGVLREDFVPEDLLLILMANAGVVRVTRDVAPHAWRRTLALMLEACRAGHTGPLPAAPTAAQARRAMAAYACTSRISPAPR